MTDNAVPSRCGRGADATAPAEKLQAVDEERRRVPIDAAAATTASMFHHERPPRPRRARQTRTPCRPTIRRSPRLAVAVRRGEHRRLDVPEKLDDSVSRRCHRPRRPESTVTGLELVGGAGRDVADGATPSDERPSDVGGRDVDTFEALAPPMTTVSGTTVSLCVAARSGGR